MFIKIYFTFLLIFCLGVFSFNICGQTEDEQINLLEKQIRELKQQRIKKLEAEKRKLEAEIESSSANKSSIDVTRESPRALSPAQPAQPPETITNTNHPTAVTPPAINNPPDSQPQANCLINKINPSEETRLQEAICRLTNKIAEQRINKLTPNLSIQQITTVLAAKITQKEFQKEFFLESERQRTDKQIGSSPNSSGTTSLAVKGGMPTVIGWAVEQGAATSTVSGNTVTMRLNPYNLGKALFYNQGIIDLRLVEPRENAFDSFLKKVSLGFSFDTTRGTNPSVFIGSKQQLSAFSFRYEFINHRNPFSPRHNQKRLAFFDSQNENFDKVASAFDKLVDKDFKFKNEILIKWLDETNTELALIPLTLDAVTRRSRIQAVIESRIKALPTEELSKQEDFKAAIESFTEGSIGFKNARDGFIEEINGGTVATFEYTNNREPIAPDTSNFRFIWEKGIFRNTDFTFNASLTMYNKKPNFSGVKKIRDFQFALQLDKSLKDTLLGDSILSFAGRYERLNSDTVDALGVVMPNSKGDVAIGQIKLTIPIRDTGIRLPLSVTFANRTDLIKESTVRANFGFTFDLDPLFARFKPF